MSLGWDVASIRERAVEGLGVSHFESNSVIFTHLVWVSSLASRGLLGRPVDEGG